MKKVKRAAFSLLINGLAIFLAWQAFFRENQGAANVLLLFAWVSALMSIVALCGKVALQETREHIKKSGRSIPAWVAVSLDLAVIIPAAWFSHWTISVLMLISMLFEGMLFTNPPETKNN